MKNYNTIDLGRRVMILVGILSWMGGLLVGCGGGGSSSYIPQEANQIPSAEITLPTNTFFNEGENIAFSGFGSDSEGAQLTDDALVWTSSIDGIIGIGSTLITSALSSGEHDISLSVTDSIGTTFTTGPVNISVESTRFIKMGSQTAGVVDAYYAFDGDHDTAAMITTDETASFHFKAYIGGEDTFLFKIKLGASALGSILSVEGLVTNGNWQSVNDVDLFDDKTVAIRVVDAQTYKDAEGYINLRTTLVNGQSLDSVPVYEFWRDDPIYDRAWATGVVNPDLACDGDRTTAAVIKKSESMENFLLFKAYVGWRHPDIFKFNVLLNYIGPINFLVIEAEDMSSGIWTPVSDLVLDTTEIRSVSVQNVQSYLDEDGYIRFRVYWIGIKPLVTVVELYEIWRTDPFFEGPKTSFVVGPENSVDDDSDTFAEIHYYWGELDHEDFLHVQTYVGDASPITFSVEARLSALPNADLVVEGEYEPDKWSMIDRTSLGDVQAVTIIELQNAREFVDADGHLNLRFRWESEPLNHDAYIYEIQRKQD